MGRSVQWNYQKPNSTALCFSKNFHIGKFLDSCVTILMWWTAIMAECVEVTPHRCHCLQAPLKHKSTKWRWKSWDYYGSNSSCPGKSKGKKEDLRRKMSSEFVKSSMTWWVASGCSKHTFLDDKRIHFILQTLLATTLQPRASDIVIPPSSMSTCMSLIMHVRW